MTVRKPIISARRTENLEALLQKLWTLRPLYRDKQAFTITAGVAALIREIERTEQRFETPLTAVDDSVETGTSSTDVAAMASAQPMNETPDLEAQMAQVSTDAEW